MTVIVRFFARFRELLGSEISVRQKSGITISGLIREVVEKNRDGYEAIFDEKGDFRNFVIVMRNGQRVGNADAKNIIVSEGDEIAVFPPVAGG